MADSFNSWSGFTAAQGSGAFQNWNGQAYSGFQGNLDATQQGPDAPTAVSANPRDASAIVSWTAPAAHDSVITSYVVTASTGQVQTLASGGTFTGLTNGVAVTFTVRAVSAVAIGPASAASNSVTPSDTVVPPDAPTIGTAVAGDTDATLTWTDNGDGGAPITSYDITSSPATTTQHFSSGGTFTGLTNGVAYTFTVKAVNSAGASSASAASNSVTPQSAFTYPTNVGLVSTALTAWDQSQSLTAAQDFTAPNGDPGYTLTAANAGDYHVVYYNNANYSGNSLSQNCAKFSVVAKKGTVKYLGLNVYNGFAANFDLDLGVVGTTTGAGTTSSITAIPGAAGWYLCEMVLAVAQQHPLLISTADTLAHALANYPSSQVISGWSGTVQVYHAAAYN